ncbi:hypothetical protein AB0F91_11870 [Amycolatopsis sp. NPDC023774]|uniref:hypothetical protein n=1 Tax=Amycolatopsis sp. NPDC023774 TaxID=3155015 RepID=UPI0033D0059A
MPDRELVLGAAAGHHQRAAGADGLVERVDRADAHRRGVLRQVGAVYQFRHARLQERLADAGSAAGGRPGLSDE